MKSLAFVLLLLLPIGKLEAQEVQVAFDSAGQVEVVNSEMARKAKLFQEYPNFLEARLFQEKDSSFILEIASYSNGKLSRDRLTKTPQEAQALRNAVMASLTESAPTMTIDQSSRSKFQIWETLLSTFAYGPLLISSFSPDNGAIATGIELVIGGSGYLLSSVLTENSSMSDGQASLALGGAFLGLEHGVFLDGLFAGDNLGQEMGAISTATSIAETVIGYEVAKNNRFTEGKSDIIRYGGLFGIMDGASLAGAIDNHASFSLISGASLLGSAAGFALGTAMSNDETYTRGNASAVLTSGIFGTMIPPLIYASAISFNSDGPAPTPLMLLSLAGNVGGVVLGHSLMRDRHLSTGEGTEVVLGTSAGFLIGTGLGFIFTSSDRFTTSPWPFTMPIVIGTAVGYAVTISAIGKGTGDRPRMGVNWQVNPGALLGALLPSKATPRAYGSYVPPALMVQARF